MRQRGQIYHKLSADRQKVCDKSAGMLGAFAEIGQTTNAAPARLWIHGAGKDAKSLLYSTGMSESKHITLEELTSPGCRVCRAFELFWRGIEKDWPNVTYRHIDVTTPEGQEIAGKYMIFASPGIILNGELFATGGFDKEKFIQKLKALSS